MGRTFIIEELNTLGGVTPAEGLQRFEWDSAHRNIPVKPWTFGVTQRTVRTDYPGGDDPTEQVLGPNFTPFSLSGRWDDRYNPRAAEDPSLSPAANKEAVGGYAAREQKRFENMVRRGNVVRITFEELTVQGIITDATFDYRHAADIGYSFTFSPHHRQPGGFFALKRSPRGALNAKSLLAEVTREVEILLAAHQKAPRNYLVDAIFADVDGYAAYFEDSLAFIQTSIEQRALAVPGDPQTSLLRLASSFFTMASDAAALINRLGPLDSSEALAIERGVLSLRYDVWSRTLMYQSRRIITTSQRAAADLQQRAKPNAIALYRPLAGESLYSISQRFYQTPHNWRAIAQRNNISVFTLTGEEILVIPESTGR